VVWLVWFRDHPEKSDSTAKPDVDHAEQSFGAVFRSPAMMLAMVQYFAGNFTFFICLSWMLPYLKDRFSLSDAAAARYAMMPLLFGATAQWVAGFAVDRLHASSWRPWSRRIPAISGFILAIAGMIALTIAGSPVAAATCFALAAFGADLTISPSWTFCQDIGGRNSGAVSGSMNMVGNFGSFVSSIAFPWLIALTGSAGAYFLLAALLNVAAIVCWLWMRPVSLAAPKLTELEAQI
jgi:ACS family glucarate transporter-like MFS transporter